MALDLVAIRRAVADQIQRSVGRTVNVYGGYVPDTLNLPAVVVYPDTEYVNYEETFGSSGLAEVQLRLRVFIPPGPGVDGQQVLDEFLSAGAGHPNSLLDAVNAGRTFGGVVANSVVNGCRSLGRIFLAVPDGQTPVDAGEILLTLRTHRTA
jgi:hypothetical protein